MITHEEAIGQRRAYAAAAKASTVVQCRIMLRKAWSEWRKAVDTLDELDSGDYSVTLYCEIVPGHIVADDRHGDCAVVRKMENGGQTTLHLESRTGGAPIYLNYAGPTSPVVVLDIPMTITEPAILAEPPEHADIVEKMAEGMTIISASDLPS